MNTNEFTNIFYNGVIYKIYRDQSESYDQFYNRAWFIARKQPKTIAEFKTIEVESRIWRNTHYLGTKYN